MNLKKVARPGRPFDIANVEMIGKIHKIVIENRRLEVRDNRKKLEYQQNVRTIFHMNILT